MIIRTVKRNGEFTILPKAPLNDKSLSWEARGLLSYLLEKPDGWEISLANLVRNGPAQEHKVRRILGELKDAGYVARIRVNGNGGTFRWITQIFESPQPVVPPYSENHHMVGQPSRDYPLVVNPHVDDPQVDNPRVENREIYQYPLQQEESEVIPNQKQKQQQQHASPAEADTVSGIAAAAVLEEVRSALQEFGVTGRIVEELSTCPLEHVQGWIAYADTQEGLKNPIGFVVKQLRSGVPAPAVPEEEDPDSYEALKRRYVPAAYADIIEH